MDKTYQKPKVNVAISNVMQKNLNASIISSFMLVQQINYKTDCKRSYNGHTEYHISIKHYFV